MKRHLLPLLAAILLAGLCATTHSALAQTSTAIVYQYTALNYPGSESQSTNLYGINNVSGMVGSYGDSAGFTHGFKYKDGVFTAINFPGAAQTTAMGINDVGDIVGWYANADAVPHGFLLHNGAYSAIDYPGSSSTLVNAINKNGTYVGAYDNEDHAFIYKNGAFTQVSVPTETGVPNYYTMLNGINNHGEFAGQVLSGDYFRGFWGTTSDIDFVEAPFSKDVHLYGLNDIGDVVGCHDGANSFVVFNPEAGENENTEKFPPQEPLSNPYLKNWCASAINNARIIVGRPAYVAIPVVTLTVTSPINNSSDSSPVHVAASASGVNSIAQIEVWLNSNKIYQVSGNKLNANLTLPAGSNQRFAVHAVDSKGTVASVVETITVK